MAMLEAFVHDPLINWRLLNTGDTAGEPLPEGGDFSHLDVTGEPNSVTPPPPRPSPSSPPPHSLEDQGSSV